MAKTPNQFADEVLIELEKRFRFNQIEDVLDRRPTQEEKRSAVFDALGEINAFPPETSFNFDTILGETSPNYMWRNVLYTGSGRNVIRILVNYWTYQGFSQTIEEFSIENRLGDYQSLFDTLNTQFNEQLLQLKTSTQKFVKRVVGTGAETGSIITRVSAFGGSSWRKSNGSAWRW